MRINVYFNKSTIIETRVKTAKRSLYTTNNCNSSLRTRCIQLITAIRPMYTTNCCKSSLGAQQYNAHAQELGYKTEGVGWLGGLKTNELVPVANFLENLRPAITFQSTRPQVSSSFTSDTARVFDKGETVFQRWVL